MARKAFLVSIAMSAAALVGPAFASSSYTIDPEHVTVSFTVQHSKWAKYQGMVRKIAGEIIFDREHIESSSVHVEMDAMSVDTLNVGRDYELQGYGLLEAKKNPQIKFVSTSVEKTGEKTGKIVGNMTMAGVTHPVALDVIFDGEGISPWDNFQRVGFSATGTLNTNDFGLKDLIRLEIGPKLDFTIEVEATTY
jgi:polyisoprenoid-binding protein YceI